MSTAQSVVTVAATATVLLAADDNVREVSIHVPTGGQAVALGGSDVTFANGLLVAAGATFQTKLPPQHSLYGIVTSSTQGTRVLAIGG
ncbi:MAG: hypothetical protein WC054_02355 [Candidatus Nanopelagicales bacterium]